MWCYRAGLGVAVIEPGTVAGSRLTAMPASTASGTRAPPIQCEQGRNSAGLRKPMQTQQSEAQENADHAGAQSSTQQPRSGPSPRRCRRDPHPRDRRRGRRDPDGLARISPTRNRRSTGLAGRPDRHDASHDPAGHGRPRAPASPLPPTERTPVRCSRHPERAAGDPGRVLRRTPPRRFEIRRPPGGARQGSAASGAGARRPLRR